MKAKTYDLFNSRKLKKYWKNQIPTQRPYSKIEDLYFPPNKASILGIDNMTNALIQ